MNRFTEKKSLWLSVAFLLLFSWTSTETFSQSVYSKPAPPSKPFLQNIEVKKENSSTTLPSPSSTPLITKTAKVTPVVPNAAYSALGEVDIPGYTGILVETLDGKPVVDSYSNYAFNPASNVKVATAFAVIKTFGPEYRFPTNVWTDGTVDAATGTLFGNLYVSGRDPIFNYEHAVAIANELNRFGIRTVSGDLIVTDNFAMNFNGSALRSASTLASTMDSGKRSAAATKSWLSYLTSSGKYGQVQGVPGVSITGGTYVQPMPSNVRLLFTHESAPLKEIVKVTLCYSNNFLAEKLGDMVGGAYAVARIVQLNAGLAPNEFVLQTSSGLGINRVTPQAQMKLLRTFRNELARYKMTFADVMPVAGIDKGTLERRFDTDFAMGSVVGKTGTLGNTDAGVSSLTGEINTKNGKLLFVIFNQKGSVPRFRAFQNSYVSLIQSQFGGPTQMSYNPVAFDVRMAKSRITYPDSRARLEE